MSAPDPIDPVILPPVVETNPLCGPYQGQGLDVLRWANPLGELDKAVTLACWQRLWVAHRARMKQPPLLFTDKWFFAYAHLLWERDFLDLFFEFPAPESPGWDNVLIIAVPASVRRARRRRARLPLAEAVQP